MSINKIAQSLAAGAMIAMFSVSASANVLVNPSFETPDTGGAPPEYFGATGWSDFGGTTFTIEDYVFGITADDGNQVLKAFGFGGITQQFATSVGQVWSASASGLNPSADAMTPGQVGALNIEWIAADGVTNVGTEFGTSFSGADPTDTWIPLSASGAAPAGAAFARIVLITGDFAGPGGGSAVFDNASLTAVPVPAAVWLFGSGLIGLVGVARRRKA